jgi:hypothetical protein
VQDVVCGRRPGLGIEGGAEEARIVGKHGHAGDECHQLGVDGRRVGRDGRRLGQVQRELAGPSAARLVGRHSSFLFVTNFWIQVVIGAERMVIFGPVFRRKGKRMPRYKAMRRRRWARCEIAAMVSSGGYPAPPSDLKTAITNSPRLMSAIGGRKEPEMRQRPPSGTGDPSRTSSSSSCKC